MYELTSLSEGGAHNLKQFADGDAGYLQSWQMRDRRMPREMSQS